jgi:hypothetical protein
VNKDNYHKLLIIQGLAGKAQVSYTMEYADGPNTFYFAVSSDDPREQYVGTDHSFDIAADCFIDHLKGICP